jgi:hypothetical protein
MDELLQKPLVALIYDHNERMFAMRLKNDLLVYGINTWPQETNLGLIGEKAKYLVTANTVIVAVLPDDLTEVAVTFPANENGTIVLRAQGDYEETLAFLLRSLGARGFAATIRIRINEEPLTAHNLNTILSALTDLSTKYWLIAKGRFADLIEYTQTHNGRFAEEAQIVITRISYNSPFNMDWKIDLSAPSVAEALVTTIDGITQKRERLEKAQLENRAKSLEMKGAEQKIEQDNQIAALEQEKQRLELEQRRLEILEKQLEVQKKGIEYALEIAERVVDTLHPSADPATRAMEIQTYLPRIIQLQNGKGLELALPTPPSNTEETSE